MSIRVQYITIEGDNAEIVSAALRALSLAPRASESAAPMVAERLAPAVERTSEPRALPRTPRASANPAAAVAKPPKPERTVARAPRIANGMAKDVIRQAFASDENYPLAKLATKLYGAADGRGVQKVKFNIAGLVSAGELVRTGAASYRASEVKRATDDEEREDDDESNDDDTSEEEEE